MNNIKCANIADLRLRAKCVLPRPIFDLYDGAAFEEKTLAANIADFAAIRFRQRVVRDVANRSLATNIVGQNSSMPLVISPTGMSGLLHRPLGEIHVARAAKKAGIPFTLSVFSVCSLEQVVDDSGPVWFQFPPFKDRHLMASLVMRAIAAQCPVLVVTVSWPITGQSNRSIRNGLNAIPPKLSLKMAWEFLRKPGWTTRTLRAGTLRLGNFHGHIDGPADYAHAAGLLQDAPSWDDIAWIRSLWPHKLIVKGILDRDDARCAFDAGADAISVSNHGGNCLDETTSTISMLPKIVDAVGDLGEIMVDGGVRTGQDVLKAAALGARACLIGRAHLYGLAAAGESGVSAAIEFIRNELSITLGYVGLKDVRDADRSILSD